MHLLKAIQKDLRNAPTARLMEIAEITGVPFTTIRRVVTGYTPRPSYDVVYRLSKYRTWDEQKSSRRAA